MMNNTFKRSLLAAAILSTLGITSQVYAAEENAEVERKARAESEVVTEDDSLLEDEETERIVVTGSRIRRAEFSEASPVQIISGEISRELGLFNTGDMLQESNQASGVQYDNTFGGFVLDNGPGSSTISFRNLGAGRTLVLVNGRRMAPAGVGGAPTAPDLNLIPSIMVDRIENLFDGASTVYGSDAIAGVANVVLKKDVEGFQFVTGGSKPKGNGGEETEFGALLGNNNR